MCSHHSLIEFLRVQTLIFMTILVQAAAAADQNNSLLFVGDFETGKLDGYSVSGNAPTITSTYSRDGEFAIESRLNRLNSEISYRTEVRARAPDPVIDSAYWKSVGQEYWYGFSVYVPKPFVADTIWEIVAQFHRIPDVDEAASGLNPPLSFEIAGNQWRIINRYSLEQPTTSRVTAFDQRVGDVEDGRWTDWVVNVRWSATAGEGFLRIWKNGVMVVDTKGPNTYNDQRGPYFKMGIYKGWRDRYTPEGIVKERVYYHDAFKMTGPDGSYVAVAPGGTARPQPPAEISVRQ